MAKIYVFGIGGTGSRVLRSLTMLLASGVQCSDAIVPIIIDPDASSGEVERTVNLMQRYAEIRSNLTFDTKQKNNFFRTEIKEIFENFKMPMVRTTDGSFKDYIDLAGMDKSNRALAEILFSEKNLSSDMKVGFKGNPNIGSIVLNQFEQSEQFVNFANEFTSEDKIFIISSIFGGTGASGFPLLLKTLRVGDGFPNKALVNNAHIGAISMLPYFHVKQDVNSQIDSATFVSKAKAALSYYHRSINSTNDIDHLYYIADNACSTYANSEGGQEQKNNAHFVELAAAMSIVDFANQKKPNSPVYKEYGIQNDVTSIIYDNLGSETRSICKSMAQFLLFAKYFRENKKDDFLSKPWVKDRNEMSKLFDKSFFEELKKLHENFIEWLTEMGDQDRKFKVLKLHTDKNRVYDILEGKEPKKVWVIDSNFELFNNRLNNQKGEETKNASSEQMLLELFYLATAQLVEEKLKTE